MTKFLLKYKPLLIISSILLLIVGVFLYSKRIISPTTIALISDSSAVCHTNIDSFIMAEGCGDKTFKITDAKCKDGRTIKEGNGISCIDQLGAYTRAQEFCGSTCLSSTTAPKPSLPSTPVPTPPIQTPRICAMEAGSCMSKTNNCMRYNDSCAKADFCASPYTLYPTPTPLSTPVALSWPPTPPPTSDPSPLVSCALEVYKIPPTLPLSQAFMLPEYLQKNNNVTAKAGERYVINMVLTNLKKYDLTNGNLKLTTWSDNILGQSAPYSVYSTGVNNCSYGFPDKSVRCEIPSLQLKANSTVKPQTFMVIDANKVDKATSTAITFRGIYSASTVSCPSVNFTVTPTVNQKCYGIGKYKWCRNVVVN